MKRAAAALLLLISVVAARNAHAQANLPYLGEIEIFPYTFCPAGWAPLNGQLMSISQYTALVSLLGTTFGGAGVSTFALPKWGPALSANGGPLRACIALQGVFPSQN